MQGFDPIPPAWFLWTVAVFAVVGFFGSCAGACYGIHHVGTTYRIERTK